ncbi:MAG: hypothetical protein HKN27_17105 [Silicimonas sp.]|nr:hypothetical protein [Silicimonas sp.]
MRGVLLLAVLVLAACATEEPEQPPIYELSAAAIVRALYPGINAPPVAACIVDNASAEEIDVLATTNSESNADRFDMVELVLAREGTQSCIEAKNVTFPEVI